MTKVLRRIGLSMLFLYSISASATELVWNDAYIYELFGFISLKTGVTSAPRDPNYTYPTVRYAFDDNNYTYSEVGYIPTSNTLRVSAYSKISWNSFFFAQEGSWAGGGINANFYGQFMLQNGSSGAREATVTLDGSAGPPAPGGPFYQVVIDTLPLEQQSRSSWPTTAHGDDYLWWLIEHSLPSGEKFTFQPGVTYYIYVLSGHNIFVATGDNGMATHYVDSTTLGEQGILDWEDYVHVAFDFTPDVCPSGCTYSSIQAAVDAAQTGANILVGPAVYNERVTIAKQVTLESTKGAATTIIDGTGLGGSVVTIGSGATLKGFTITGGEAANGAGIYANDLAYIIGNTITGNNASNNGGGIFVYSDAEISENVIESNSATSNGGGVIVSRGNITVNIKKNIFRSNSANYSGALAINPVPSTVIIEDNVFDGNSATSGISAINLPANSIMSIDGNVYKNNSGAAVYAGTGSTAVIKNGLFVGNDTAIFLASDSQAKVVNTTITGSTTRGITAALGCQTVCSEVVNSIIWGNATDILGSVSVSYSILSAPRAGTGNIVADPLFSDAASGNFQLQPGSPAIDAGKDAATYGVTLDIADASRPQDGDGLGAGGTGDGSDYDIGAYEYVR